MDSVTLTAPAKLNLRLLVGPVQPDGYHPIRSLLVALDGLADTVTVERAETRSVRCAGIEGASNLAWRALDALERHVGRRLPCAVTIDKRIPTQAGLGGGSSDAAATLVGANRLMGLGLEDETLERIAAQVGSDVPFFVRGGAQWATGRGEVLSPAPMPAFTAVIVKPAFGLATPDVYRAFDATPAPALDDGSVAVPAEDALPDWVRNDLWPAALRLRPELAELADALVAAGARATVLCGSGAALAAFVADRASAEVVRRSVDGAEAFIVAPCAQTPAHRDE